MAVAAALALLPAAASAEDDIASAPLSPIGAGLTIACEGVIAQGGLALCRTAPGATIEIDGERVARADAEGWATLAFERDAEASYTVRAVDAAGEASAPLTLAVADREFVESEVGGLDCDYVEPRTPEDLAEIARSTREKNAAWRVYAEGIGARAGFVAPGDGIQTSPFGSRRRKYGEGCETVSVHWGLDLRAATGSPVRAPAAGVVSLAENLYFEGGAVFLDHGHGLVSVFMHMSEIDVKPGDVVAPGDQLGLAGMTGTANGPHIHWGLKWRNVFHDDGVTGGIYIDPSLALELGRAAEVEVSEAE
jgi:murein DD-endopeptidase MepM/ murein hydrolase activator NlpD